MAADLGIEMQEITRRLTTELRPKVDAVQQTPAWTREGKRARARLKQFLAELRGLALASGQQCAIDGVDKVRLFILGQRDATGRAAELGRCWQPQLKARNR